MGPTGDKHSVGLVAELRYGPCNFQFYVIGSINLALVMLLSFLVLFSPFSGKLNTSIAYRISFTQHIVSNRLSVCSSEKWLG